jgi:hypothetical protein
MEKGTKEPSYTSDAEMARIAGYLIRCGLRPKLAINKDIRYRDAIELFNTDYTFQQLTIAFADGLSLRILDSSRSLSLAVTDTASPFAPNVTDLIGSMAGSADNRMLIGVSMIGICAFCYPTASSLDNIQAQYPSVMRVRDLMVEFAKQASETSHQEKQEEITGLRQTYSLILEKAGVQVSPKNNDKFLYGSLPWSIDKAFSIFEGYNFLKHLSDENGGTYQTRDKFRFYVRDLIGNRAFDAVQEYAESNQTERSGRE